MLVKIKRQHPDLKTDGKILNVFKEDKEHFYVRNKNGVIHGILKGHFKEISKQEERTLKIDRILELESSVSMMESCERMDYKINKITVSWSGEYPNLCSGTWEILIDQMELPIPDMFSASSMGTSGEYSSWHLMIIIQKYLNLLMMMEMKQI
jgi:hypothetical protein